MLHVFLIMVRIKSPKADILRFVETVGGRGRFWGLTLSLRLSLDGMLILRGWGDGDHQEAFGPHTSLATEDAGHKVFHLLPVTWAWSLSIWLSDAERPACCLPAMWGSL